jgi:hypothetical protein
MTALVRPQPAAKLEGEVKAPLVRHRDETQPINCPFGHVKRIVTGGEGGVANVHVVKITKGTPYLHQGYDETTAVNSGIILPWRSP